VRRCAVCGEHKYLRNFPKQEVIEAAEIRGLKVIKAYVAYARKRGISDFFSA